MSLVGMGAFPNFINWAIPRYGWRTTYVIMGGMLLLIMTPLGLIFVRQRPEDHGLRPDGGRDEGTPGGEGEHLEENWTLQEAMRTPAFWIVTGAVGISALVSTGLYFHTVSIFEDNGLSADTAALAFVPIALTGALSRLVSGYLTDNMPVRFLLAASLFFLVLTLNMVRFLNPQLAYLYGIVHGVKGGIITTVSGVVWANYFGRKHLGSISGVARLAGTIGSALGPMPFGIIRDVMGSYNPVLTIVTIPTLVLTVACFFVHKPQKS
jgi:sugar phosphate permease